MSEPVIVVCAVCGMEFECYHRFDALGKHELCLECRGRAELGEP